MNVERVQDIARPAFIMLSSSLDRRERTGVERIATGEAFLFFGEAEIARTSASSRRSSDASHWRVRAGA